MQQTPEPYLMPLRVFLFRQHGEVACKARAIGLNLLSGLLPLAAELRMSHTSEIVRPAGDMEGIVHHRGERRSAAMAACSPRPVAVRKDDAPAADQAAMTNVAGMPSFSGGGGLIQTTSGCLQQRVLRLQRRGCCWRARS
jgi:hypothetical protein